MIRSSIWQISVHSVLEIKLATCQFLRSTKKTQCNNYFTVFDTGHK